MKIICCRCKKKIVGVVKVSNKKSKNRSGGVDFYCEKCFKQRKKERMMDDHRKQKAGCNRANKK